MLAFQVCISQVSGFDESLNWVKVFKYSMLEANMHIVYRD